MKLTYLATLGDRSQPGGKLSFSPQGDMLACTTAGFAIGLWEVATRRLIATYAGHTRGVSAVAFRPDGKLLASGSWDRTIRLWDMAAGGEHATLLQRRARVHALTFDPNGRYLASGEDGARVYLWDMSSMEEDANLALGAWAHEVSAVSFSHQGAVLAIGCTDSAVLCRWVRTSKQAAWMVEAHDESVAAVAFAPDDLSIASAGDDGMVRVWEADTGRLRRELAGHVVAGRMFQPVVNALAFAPDGHWLASGGEDNRVTLWEVATGGEVQTLDHPDAVRSVAFSSDGTLLACGCSEAGIHLWRVEA